MVRTVVVCCLVVLVVGTTGCRMCAHPYDYCGPTYTGQCGETCAWNARAGSVLSPPVYPPPQGEIISEALTPVPEDLPASSGDLIPTADDTAESTPTARPAVHRHAPRRFASQCSCRRPM